VLVVTRYVVPAEEWDEFRALAKTALEALVACAGCLGARVGRSVDDPTLWTLTTTWQSVGDYRRALSSYEVKLHAVPLMYRAVDEPTAFEDLIAWTPDGGLAEHDTARSGDAATSVRPGPAGR